MKRLVLPSLAALLGLTGCVETALNPTDTVVVKGSAVNEDKKPIAQTTLKLYRSLNSLCVLTDHFRDVKTDTDGAYTFELTGAETQNGDIARCFEMHVPADENGAYVETDFLVQLTQVEVPTMQRWNGAVAVASSSSGVEITYKSIKDTHGFDATHGLYLRKDQEPVWQQSAVSSSPVAVSEYILEDFTGVKASLTASKETKGSGTAFHTHFGSNAVDVPAKQKVPVSRGAKCQIGAKTYETGCPYTDGLLAANAENSGSDLRIDLPQPKQLKKIILRDFSANISAKVLFEGSTDNGVNWTKLGELSENSVKQYVEYDVPSTVPAVAAFRVRVEGQNEPKILGLREVSLFE